MPRTGNLMKAKAHRGPECQHPTEVQWWHSEVNTHAPHQACCCKLSCNKQPFLTTHVLMLSNLPSQRQLQCKPAPGLQAPTLTTHAHVTGAMTEDWRKENKAHHKDNQLQQANEVQYWREHEGHFRLPHISHKTTPSLTEIRCAHLDLPYAIQLAQPCHMQHRGAQL